jgi:hypothetical protein
MHVAIDAVGNHVGGGWAVLRRTVAELLCDPRVSKLTVFGSPLDVLAGSVPRDPKLRWVERGREHRSPRARLAWFSIGLDSQVDRVRADVVLSLNGVGRTMRPRVCVIQQAFAITGNLRALRPRRFAAKLAVLRRETRRSAARAQAVVVQTTWMAHELRENLGLVSVVLPLGLPRERAGSRERLAMSSLVVGPDLPYKRLDLAREAVATVRQTVPGAELTVVEGESPTRVEALLERATLLLAPSETESFGLPVVEGFASGCPVVAAERPWARAVADNAALYFDSDAHSAARAVVECLREPALREDLAARGRARLAAHWAMRPYEGLVDLFEAVA